MIIEFSVTNFRSIKEEQIFSFVAEASKSKPDNVFEAKIRQGVALKDFLKDEEKGEEKSTFETIRLLKSAVIYGANASGKSNVIKAFEVFHDFCINSNFSEKKIENYNPFKLDEATEGKETNFTLSFIGPFKYKYQYSFSFNQNEILSEELIYYPLGQARNLFKRIKTYEEDISFDSRKVGDDLEMFQEAVPKNILFLPAIGFIYPNFIIKKIHTYLISQFQFLNTSNSLNLEKRRYEIGEKLNQQQLLKKRLENLINIADTKIKGFDLELVDDNPSWLYEDIDYLFEPIGLHQTKNSKLVRLHFKEESRGTNMLYVLGGKILEQLDKGGTMFIDEIDTSLHPRLAKFLVLLFQHPKSNPKNAQLIFTTHETTFLDRNLFRREQIWFTEKDEYGQTELYSMQDFDKVREDTPFEKWYLAGKFGGLPDIKELEFIFGDGEEN